MSDSIQTNTSVLIVGGGLNGLTTALLLAHHGVRCVLVERHPRISSPPMGRMAIRVRSSESNAKGRACSSIG
jgi:putative polyketide hydroxylase